MANKRTGLAPWSLSREAGIESATVDGRIDVPQILQPVIDTGFVDDKGNWKGTKSSDEQFIAFQTDEGIPNSGQILTPSAISDTRWPINMTGYKHILLAIKPTNGGNVNITAVMGPDSNSFANISPVNSASSLRGNLGAGNSGMSDLLLDSSESLTADVWNIFTCSDTLHDQKLLQFKIINNSGGESTIETAFMRLV
jgi:hypothetical protein